MTHPLIAAALAMPHTHKVVTTYACGKTKEFLARSLRTAENHAVSERRKIGRYLIDRDTMKQTEIVSVEVKEI